MPTDAEKPQDIDRPDNRLAFAHLHLHTEYSLLDGGNKIKPLIDRVKDLGMDAVAVTDHGNLHGAVEFYTRATAAGVKPILGIEAYVAPADRHDRKSTGIADGGLHLVLLAENDTGWRNLLKLSSDAFLRGFYYRPRMDKTSLAEHADGLIAINGHLGSSIAHHLLQYVQTNTDEHYRRAIEEARWHAQTFAPNHAGEPRFFIEIQRHSIEQQQRINPLLVKLARELDLPLVCDNDVHYLRAEDYDTHDSLCCISMQKTKDDPSRIHYSPELYLKSPRQMHELFADLPDALHNTVRIAERCNVKLDFSANHAPMVRIVSDYDELPLDAPAALELIHDFSCEHPVGSTGWYKALCSRFRLEPYDRHADDASPELLKRQCDGALRMLAEAGAIWRYGSDPLDPEKRRRLDRELDILADKLISAYILIVWDFVNWARQQGIPAAARGSAVGTIVGYVLGLSNACPVQYGLLFERFTDPDRTEYPDIDVDICQNGRADVINYVREKYGYVAQIITFGRLKARQAIKDVARVNAFSPSEGQRLANLVPSELNITIDAALDREPDFRAEYENDPRVRAVIQTARALEDHARHAGVHAAGVVIATEPLDNIVPLCTASGAEDAITQWDGPTCEKLGLLKMDFLGLRTLSTIELALEHIRESMTDDAVWRAVGRRPDDGGPHPLDLERLRYDDQNVLALFRRADTAGIFQFESGGMRKLLLDMQPDRLHDLIAANALFRPGPMDLIPDYCMRKHGKQKVPAVHPIVDHFTAETYGIMVYQEQVMQIVHGLGDIPLRQAYTLIKAISKKKYAVINELRPRFIDGAEKKGLSDRKAGELFDLILKFAGYGFNKSHSTGYAIIAYQTAYLKTQFPAQYMAALLTFESGARKIDDWAPYLEDCKHTPWPDHCPETPHEGIDVNPPDLNLSHADFSVVFDRGETRDNLHGHIRFGLGAIKGVGKSAIAGIIEQRDADGPFASIFDFCERVPSRVANKAAIEALIKSGAFDSLHGNDRRAALLAALDDAIASGQQAAEDRRAGQMSIFAAVDGRAAPAPHTDCHLPDVKPWDRLTLLANEKETLGIHISGHPLDQYESRLREYAAAGLNHAAELPDETTVVLGGILTRVRVTMVKSGRSAGEKMAMITLQDKTASIEGVVFSSVFARDARLLTDGAVVLLVGRIDHSRGATQIIVDQTFAIDDAPLYLARCLELTFHDRGDRDAVARRMQQAADVLRRSDEARASLPGRPVEIIIQVITGGRRVALRASGLRAIPEPTLISRLADLIAPDHLRVVGGYIPSRNNNHRGRRNSYTARPPASAPA